MASTNLPATVSPGANGHLGNHQVIHDAVNRLTKSTELRDCTSLLTNGWTVSGSTPYARIIWENGKVTLSFRGLDGSAATDPTFLTFSNNEANGGLALGFRCSNAIRSIVSYRTELHPDAAGDPVSFDILQSGARISPLYSNYKRSFGSIEVQISWTSANYPTYLPPLAV